jgi:hypothetical protein
MDGLSPHKLNKSFAVKIGSGRRAHKYTLAVGSMGLSLLDGTKPYKSYIYANLVSWEANSSGFSLVVGVEKKKVEFVTSEGEEIAALITVHAREIAEQYLADQRREEERKREDEERRQRAEHERLRQQHRQLEDQHEQQERERHLRQQQEDQRVKQLGSPEHAFRPPPPRAGAASDSPQKARRRSSLDSEMDRIQQDAPGTAASGAAAGGPERAFSQEEADAGGVPSTEVRIRQERAQQLAEEAMELMQHANRPDDYKPAQLKCESALQLDKDNQLAQGTLKHVMHALKGGDMEEVAPKARFAGLGTGLKKVKAAGSSLQSVAPKEMMKGMKFGAAKTGKNVGGWVKQKADEHVAAAAGPTGNFSMVGTVKVHVDCGFRMLGSKGVTVCAFLGSHAVHSSYAREKAEHGTPQWGESMPPIAVEEVTETLQVVLYRGDLSKYGHVVDKSLKAKLQENRIIGQVLIPLAHLYPLRQGRGVTSGLHEQTKIRPDSDLKPDASLSEETATNASGAPGEGESSEAELRTAFHKGTGVADGGEQGHQASRQHHGILGRGRKNKAKQQQQDEAVADSAMESDAGDSGLAAGGIAVAELAKWGHTMSKKEYQHQKRQTKETRTRNLAANKNDDLFRDMTLGQQQGRPAGRPADDDEDDDARSGTMSVKSAPGGLGGGSGPRSRPSRGQGVSSSRSVSGLGSDEDESLDSGTSMPVSVPSSNLLGGSGAGGAGGNPRSGPGRAVHFASTDDAASEASFASSDDTGGTGGTSGSSSFSGRKRPGSPDATNAAKHKANANLSPATKLLPEVPSSLPQPIGQGPGSWYEIFPYCSENSDGQYRTAVDELEGLAMSRPEPRLDLPGERRTLGYIRLKVQLELLVSPYSCYLREPKRSFHNNDQDELSIPRLKHNWLRLKTVLMPNHFIYRARHIAQWNSIPVSGGVLSFWAYLSLMAPFWQYPVFLLLICAVASATGRHSDRLLEEIVVWEDMADGDPDPFTLKKIGKIKEILLTVQKVLGAVASFGERLHYIFSWTDPIVTYVAIFATVVMVVVTSMVLYGLYAIAVAVGGRAIWFSFGCIVMLPPKFSIIPWSKVDDWERFLQQETELEQVLLARKKIRRKRLGDGADLQLEKRTVRPGSGDSPAAEPETGAPGSGEPEPEPESESKDEADAAATLAAAESGSAAPGGEETPMDSSQAAAAAAAGASAGGGAAAAAAAAGSGGDDADDSDVQAALKVFEPKSETYEPATSVTGMLGNLWARIPDVPVRGTLPTAYCLLAASPLNFTSDTLEASVANSRK